MDLSVFDGGSGTEYISYKAQETPHWKIDGVSADIKKFLLNPRSLKTGWGKLATGEAPHWVWSEIAGTTMDKPSDEHKAAFQLMVLLNEAHGSPVTGWREWSTNQAGARHAVKADLARHRCRCEGKPWQVGGHRDHGLRGAEIRTCYGHGAGVQDRGMGRYAWPGRGGTCPCPGP